MFFIIFYSIMAFCIYIYAAFLVWDQNEDREKVVRARMTLFWPYFLIKYLVKEIFWGTKSVLFTSVNIVSLALFKKDLER